MSQLSGYRIFIVLYLTLICLNGNSIFLADSLKNLAEQAPDKEKAYYYNQLADIMLRHSPEEALEYLELALKYTGKDNKEEIVNANIIYGKYYKKQGKQDSALIKLKYALKLAEAIEFDNGIQIASGTIAQLYREKGLADSAVAYLYKSLHASKKLKDQLITAISYNELGLTYLDISGFDSALKYFDKSLEIFRDIGNSKNVARLISHKGMLYFNIGELHKALSHFQESQSICEEYNFNDILSSNYNNIGAVFWSLQNYTIALEYFHKALELNMLLNNDRLVADLNNNIGVIYKNLGQPDSAIQYYKTSLMQYRKLDMKNGLAGVLKNIGSLYLETNKPDQAIDSIKKALDIFVTYGYEKESAESYISLGKAFFLKGNIEKAEKLVLKGLDIVKEKKSHKSILTAYEVLADIAEFRGDFKSSHHWHSLYKELNDSIYIKTSTKISKMYIDYEMEKKENQIKIKDLEIEQSKNRMRTQQILIYGIIAILLIIIVFAVFIAIQYYRKLKSNKELVKKNLEIIENEKIIKESNDELKGIIDSLKQQQVDENREINKYSGSRLTEEQKNKLMAEINAKMEAEKIFLDPELSLSGLADEMNVSRTYLSQVINEKTSLQFNHLVNKYRIKEARRILADGQSEKYTLEFIAGEVGFQSMPTFYRAFKQFTGITPAFFLKSIQKEKHGIK